MPDSPQNMDSRAADLVEQALQSENQQTTLLDTTSLAAQYNDALADYIQEKQVQVERVEDRLQDLVEQEMINLKDLQASKPVFWRPAARAAWEEQQAKRQEIIQRLQNRLKHVREIKEEMGLYGPRIEELAIRKLRLRQPRLADEWDAMKTAERMEEARQRQKEQFESRSISLTRVRSIDLPE